MDKLLVDVKRRTHQELHIIVWVGYEALQDNVVTTQSLDLHQTLCESLCGELKNKFDEFGAFSILEYRVAPMVYDPMTFTPRLRVEILGRGTTPAQAEALGILTYDVGLHIADTATILIEQALDTKKLMDGI